LVYFCVEMFRFRLLPIALLLFSGLSCLPKDELPGTWQAIELPVETHWRTIWFADSLHGYIGGGPNFGTGTLLKTTDGGLSWQLDTVFAGAVNDIMFDSTGQGYLCGFFGNAYFKDPNMPQNGWVEFRNDFRNLTGLYFWSPRSGVIVSGESWGLGQTRTFGPEHFWWLDNAQDFNQELQAVWACTKDIWVVVGMGWVMRSTDAGRTWNRLPVTDDFFDYVQFISPERGYIGGRNGSLFTSFGSGRDWRQIQKGEAVSDGIDRVTAWWFKTDFMGWRALEGRLVQRTTDGGNTWTDWTQLPEGSHVTDFYSRPKKGGVKLPVWARGEVVWAVTEEGKLYYIE
jgi:photosystem II stability/assembly factor-like uncharacterized protein